MADFTDFNPERAQVDMNNLTELCNVSRVQLINTFGEFLTEVPELWASPKALEFGNTYVPRLCDIYVTYCTNMNKIMHDVAQAIDIVAAAHGASSRARDNVNDFSTSSDWINNFKEEKDGNVGMNIILVKRRLDVLKEQVDKFYELMDAITTLNMALYDPDGAQQAAYKELLRNFKEEMDQAIADITTTINGAVETEENNIRIAKESAASTMSA